MPQTVPGSGVGTPWLEAAEADARRAASRAQVRVVAPDDEVSAALISTTGDRVWGPRGTFKPNELRALMHAGDPVHLALDLTDDDQPAVGFAVGFLGWAPVVHVHSHQVGVVEGHRRRGVGLALKLAQRQTCLAHGITDMRWTFDPLVRRNVSFNLGTLGAKAAAFHVDFYGAMDDAINGGDATDRLEAVWRLDGPLPTRAVPDEPEQAAQGPFLLVDRAGQPEVTGETPRAGAVMAVPADYESLRRHHPTLGRAWREASRAVLRRTYDAGLRIGRVTEAGYEMVLADRVG